MIDEIDDGIDYGNFDDLTMDAAIWHTVVGFIIIPSNFVITFDNFATDIGLANPNLGSLLAASFHRFAHFAANYLQMDYLKYFQMLIDFDWFLDLSLLFLNQMGSFQGIVCDL